jgi:four helix bundle protein
MSRDTILEEKSFIFATRVVKLSKYLTSEHKEYVLSKQILRSGTSIGALIRESKYAQSKADFLHKQMIALKEANETDYWLELLKSSEYISMQMYNSIKPDIIELLKLLIASTKTTKCKMKS